MTSRTSGRIAGATFLLYIAAGITQMALWSQASGDGAGTAEVLAGLARNEPVARITVLLGFLTAVCAVTLAASIYALTRPLDPDLALWAFAFRVCEGAIGALASLRTLELVLIATTLPSDPPERTAAYAVATSLLREGNNTVLVAGSLFAIGSTLYCWQFLRTKAIPVSLAWLGLLASVLIVIVLPLRMVVTVPTALLMGMWLPMLIFEVTFALWLIVRGVNPQEPVRAS